MDFEAEITGLLDDLTSVQTELLEVLAQKRVALTKPDMRALAEMLTMDAPGRFKCSNAARQVLKVPSRSISTTDLNPLADMPSTGAGKFPAAPQTTRSISPCASRALLSTRFERE